MDEREAERDREREQEAQKKRSAENSGVETHDNADNEEDLSTDNRFKISLLDIRSLVSVSTCLSNGVLVLDVILQLRKPIM